MCRRSDVFILSGVRRDGQELCGNQPEGRGPLLAGRLRQGGNLGPQARQEEEHGAAGPRLWRHCHEQCRRYGSVFS